MSTYRGHCMCGGVQVSLKQQPPNSLRCFCGNCARSGGGSSINYLIDEAEVTVNETDCLKVYEDTQTASGNPIQRRFCGKCGSPVATMSPKFPGKAIVKASLFDSISPPNLELFTDRRQAWQRPEEGATQQ
ncbi:Mss4-like protein [Aspergillus unguis]